MSPSTPNPAARESAPYGHACAGCSKAKCRCISRGPGSSCERCHRLRRECQPSTITRKRLPRRPANRTNRLEDKLDDLVTLLKTQATANTATPGPEVIPSPLQGNSYTESETRSSPRGTVWPTEQSSASSVGNTPPITNDPSLPEPSPAQAEEYLNTFRNLHLKSQPLTYILPEVSAAQVQQERPFLWLNIWALCCKSVSEKRKLNKKIQGILAQRLLVDLDRSLDLLFGLIVYLSWAMNYMEGKKILCAYSSLAVSLVVDLRLDRPEQEDPCNETDSYKAYRCPIKQIVPAYYRTNEERRAVLSCFVIYSSISAFLKIQPMRWTPHMESCLKHLVEEQEAPGDELLVSLVKVSKVLDDMAFAAFPQHFDLEANCQPKAPSTIYVKPLVAKLEAIKRELSPNMLENRILLSYIHNAYMMINGLPTQRPSPPDTFSGLVELERAECAHACVDALEKCLNNFFSFTPEEIWGMPIAPLLHFGRSTHTLYRLCIMEDPAWDRSTVRKSVDLIRMIERAADAMEAGVAAVGLHGDGDDFFSRSVVSLRKAAAVWRRALADSDPNASIGTDTGSRVPAEAGVVDVSADGFAPMDYSQDPWLSDIFSSWEMF